MADVVRFTPKQGGRIVKGVKKAEEAVGQPEYLPPQGLAFARRARRAKVTAVSIVSSKARHTLEVGFWDGATAATTGGTWSAITMPTTCYGYTHNGNPIPVGSYVFIEFDYLDASGNAIYFSISEWSGLFPVILVQTGGANGSATTAPSYTYTVKDLSGGTLTTGASPAWARPNGLVTAATHGTAYYSGGTLTLYQTDETPQDEECPE